MNIQVWQLVEIKIDFSNRRSGGENVFARIAARGRKGCSEMTIGWSWLTVCELLLLLWSWTVRTGSGPRRAGGVPGWRTCSSCAPPCAFSVWWCCWRSRCTKVAVWDRGVWEMWIPRGVRPSSDRWPCRRWRPSSLIPRNGRRRWTESILSCATAIWSCPVPMLKYVSVEYF